MASAQDSLQGFPARASPKFGIALSYWLYSSMSVLAWLQKGILSRLPITTVKVSVTGSIGKSLGSGLHDSWCSAHIQSDRAMYVRSSWLTIVDGIRGQEPWQQSRRSSFYFACMTTLRFRMVQSTDLHIDRDYL